LRLKTLLLGTVAGLSLFSLVQAAESIPAKVSGKLTSEYARISFAWPERVRFSTRSSGNRLILTFDKPTDASVGGVMASLSPIVKKAEKSSDGKTFIFTLDKSYTTRTFMNGNVAGVDLLGAKKTAVKKSADKVPVTKPKAEAKKETQKKGAEAKKTVAPKSAAKEIPKKELAKAAPVKQPVKAEAKPAAVPLPAPQKIADTKTTAVATATPPASTTVVKLEKVEVKQDTNTQVNSTQKKEEEANEKPAVAAPVPPASNTVMPNTTASATEPAALPVTTTPTKPVSSAPVPDIAKVSAASTAIISAPSRATTTPVASIPSGVQIRFPMPDRTSAAIFERGENLWVVFGKPLALDMDAIKKQLPKSISAVEQIPSEHATILRMQQSGPVFPVAMKDPVGSDWIMVFANRPERVKERIRVRFNTEPPLKPHILLPVLETSDTVTIQDPIIGDTIQVVPVFTSGMGVTPERQFIELELLQTAQGVAIVPHTDTARIAPQRNGLKLTSAEGISLSPELPKLAMDELPDNAVSGEPTLFPYANWKLKDLSELPKERQRLIQQMVMGPGENANFARLKLLQIYLSEGLFAEALGMANDIRNHDPAFYTSEKVSAYRGAANFMMYRMQEAALDFAAAELGSLQEIDLWKTAIGEMLGDPTKRFDFMAYNDSYISKYPPSFRQKLAIIGGDLAINRQEFNTALKIFDSLNKDKVLGPIQPYVDFMIGKVSAETGQIDTAVSLWQELAKNMQDNFIRARAEFSLVNLLLQQGRITSEEAIKRLDRNRIVWRGDGLELNLLLLLGKLQLDAKNWTEGLRTYRDIVTYFPTVPEAIPTAQKMAETFSYLFNQGGADAMKPVDALSLFYEFRELTPIETEGDRMIRNLADRLVSVDLLGRAAELLDHQVRYRLQREERSRTGTKLALIYLLDRKPNEALQTLELTGYGQNPLDLQRTRNQISAAAYTDIGDYESALKVLENDMSQEGMKARLNVYWDEKDWKNVVNTAEMILSNRNDPSAPLSTYETDALLKLATAYVFQRDTSQLQYLKDYFTPLMKTNKEYPTFSFITSGSEPLDYRDMSQLTREISSIQDYLGNFRSRVKQGGLSSVVQ
jgi:tetratricopeptide (TPR) repeat protein